MPAHGGSGGAGSPRTPPARPQLLPSLPARGCSSPAGHTQLGGDTKGTGKGSWDPLGTLPPAVQPQPSRYQAAVPPGGSWGTRRSPVKPSWHKLVAKGCPQAQGQLQAASSPEAAEPPKPHTGCGRLLPPGSHRLAQPATATRPLPPFPAHQHPGGTTNLQPPSSKRSQPRWASNRPPKPAPGGCGGDRDEGRFAPAPQGSCPRCPEQDGLSGAQHGGPEPHAAPRSPAGASCPRLPAQRCYSARLQGQPLPQTALRARHRRCY